MLSFGINQTNIYAFIILFFANLSFFHWEFKKKDTKGRWKENSKKAG